jgi:hypothetical protein
VPAPAAAAAAAAAHHRARLDPHDPTLTVRIQPMEVRTFLVTLDY